MNPLPTPQVAAVHQTLSGERLTCQIQFPLTGDVDCDFIQGILAVQNAIGDMWPGRAELVLRYMADRVKLGEDSQKVYAQQAVQQGLNQGIAQYPPQPYQPSNGVVATSALPRGTIGQELTQMQVKQMEDVFGR